VDSVGSYGFQLDRILDVLSVSIDHPTLEELSAEEKQRVEAFKELAQAADDAAKEYQGQITETSVEN